MQDPTLINFTRNIDGTWTAVRSFRLNHPSGQTMDIEAGTILTPGVLYKRMDLGTWLEQSFRASSFEQFR